jgi:hypothetical protein
MEMMMMHTRDIMARENFSLIPNLMPDPFFFSSAGGQAS